MTKYIEKVADVITKAVKNGSARNQPYEAKYRENNLQLFHYGTLIFESQNGQIVRLGGYSESDKNAIGTAMQFLQTGKHITSSQSVAKKVASVQMDGWYLY